MAKGDIIYSSLFDKWYKTSNSATSSYGPDVGSVTMTLNSSSFRVGSGAGLQQIWGGTAPENMRITSISCKVYCCDSSGNNVVYPSAYFKTPSGNTAVSSNGTSNVNITCSNNAAISLWSEGNTGSERSQTWFVSASLTYVPLSTKFGQLNTANVAVGNIIHASDYNDLLGKYRTMKSDPFFGMSGALGDVSIASNVSVGSTITWDSLSTSGTVNSRIGAITCRNTTTCTNSCSQSGSRYNPSYCINNLACTYCSNTWTCNNAANCSQGTCSNCGHSICGNGTCWNTCWNTCGNGTCWNGTCWNNCWNNCGNGTCWNGTCWNTCGNGTCWNGTCWNRQAFWCTPGCWNWLAWCWFWNVWYACWIPNVIGWTWGTGWRDCSNGGCGNGTCWNGGCSNGGCSNGTCSNGGCSNGGCSNGTCSNGTCWNGGCSNGGCSNGTCQNSWWTCGNGTCWNGTKQCWNGTAGCNHTSGWTGCTQWSGSWTDIVTQTISSCRNVTTRKYVR